jgi:hypothetical protein
VGEKLLVNPVGGTVGDKERMGELRACFRLDHLAHGVAFVRGHKTYENMVAHLLVIGAVVFPAPGAL